MASILNPASAYTVLYVKDVAKSIVFYSKAFGYRSGEQTTIAFTPHETDDLPRKVEPVEVCFAYYDVEAAYKRAVDNGAVAVSAPEEKKWGQKVGYVRDPDGILVRTGSYFNEPRKRSYSANLHEEIVVLIFTFLPVKSLIRFTSVSKRFHAIILSDPKFAKAQLEAARDHHSLLYSTSASELGSLDIEKPSFGDLSSVRKLKFPFQPPAHQPVTLLGSCNGIVFVAFDETIYYIWNPSTGFFKKMPDPGFFQHEDETDFELVVYGVGYFPATNDYKVFVVVNYGFLTDKEAAIFSSRAPAWKRVELHDMERGPLTLRCTFFEEALHWVDHQHQIQALDLVKEELRTVEEPRKFKPIHGQIIQLGVCQGCLSVAHSLRINSECINVWVMREYGVRNSWTKLFSFKFSNPPDGGWNSDPFLLLETCMVAEIPVGSGIGLAKILQTKEEEEEEEEEEKCSLYKLKGKDWLFMVQYQESVLRIYD